MLKQLIESLFFSETLPRRLFPVQSRLAGISCMIIMYFSILNRFDMIHVNVNQLKCFMFECFIQNQILHDIKQVGNFVITQSSSTTDDPQPYNIMQLQSWLLNFRPKVKKLYDVHYL